MSSISLVPSVRSLEEVGGRFRLEAGSSIGFLGGAGARGVAELLSDYLKPATGFAWPVSEGKGTILLEQTGDPAPDEAGFFPEAYTLGVSAEGVRIRAESAAGLARAVQTLRQLFPAEIFSEAPVPGMAWDIPCVRIEDEPAYRWRGQHLDVGRHFFSADDVCRFIELLAQHRLNVFHWHLSEDQGWRIEIKKYPRLTEVGSVRAQTLVGHHEVWPHRFDGTPYGGFYTQDDVRRVVAFAARRHVTIVPELDMPGHMVAAIASYPWLGNGFNAHPKVREIWGISKEVLNLNDRTIGFCRDVWGELFDLFPGRFFHIGGDEAPRTEWEESEETQDLMRRRGLSHPKQMQSWFTARMIEWFAEHGRRLIGWDEILSGGIPSSAAVAVWHGDDFAPKAAAAAAAGHDLVLCSNPYCYFDKYQAEPTEAEPLAIGGFIPLERVYSFDPAAELPLPEETRPRILGAQGQLWTEYIPTRDHLDYMGYPRICALAEKLWLPSSRCDFGGFTARLTAAHRARLAAQGVAMKS